MKVRDKVVAVTGAASGIGAALCRRFAAEGAKGVAVADLDAAGAERVAGEIDGLAVACDVSREAEVGRLVRETTERFGPIDLFCSNAGIGAGGGFGRDGRGGPFAPDADWQRSWEVNLMAHVYAARALLPGMLERGSGYLLHTASAAGLLSDMTAQAYTVTKYAAVGFAEWLAINFGDRGIGVSCLCPQGVDTAMLRDTAEALGARHLMAGMIPPEAVAEAVLAGLEAEQFLILPHPEVKDYFRRKADDYDRWLRGMRRLRAKLYGE